MDEPKLIEAMARGICCPNLICEMKGRWHSECAMKRQLRKVRAALAAIRDAGYTIIPADDMTMLMRGTVREGE